MLYGKITKIDYTPGRSGGIIEYIFKDEVRNVSFVERSCAEGVKVEDFAAGDDVQFSVSVTPAKIYVNNLAPKKDRILPNEVYDLKEWAFIDYHKYKRLTEIALEEKWYFGEQPYYYKDEEKLCEKYPILENYLNYTYKRLCVEGKIIISDTDEKYAAFNTGLVDKRYLDIFALFVRNDDQGESQPWELLDFVIKGEDKGKLLTENFNVMPARAVYFSDISEVVLDSSALKENENKIDIDYEHIIVENISRFPVEYIVKNLPRSVTFQTVSIDNLDRKLSDEEEKAFYDELSALISKDKYIIYGMLGSFKFAVEMAARRTLWNYKTAVPMYYPAGRSMSILLPICLTEGGNADIALVLEKTKSSRYQGQTILTLEMAYLNSRLITRPDSDWLVTGN
ncbi:MAG: DUF3825 domain-containing protein [Clostridia bacterium]|nr:DUF3825 domain-containing protein [Clostridia bacterium]